MKIDMIVPRFVFLGMFFSGCAALTYTLNEKGSRVQIVEYLNPGVRAHLQELTMIKCELGMNAASQEANVESCRNEIRNKAAEIGATVVLFQPEQQQITKTSTNFLTAGETCLNCITLRGIAFKPKLADSEHPFL